MVVGIVVGAVVAAGIVVWAARRDGGGSDVTPSTPVDAGSVDEAADGAPLSLDSRLGYAGLGPITWGMSPDEIRRAGGIDFEVNEQCSVGWWPALVVPTADQSFQGVGGLFGTDGRLSSIQVWRPGVRTISGIEIGSSEEQVRATYPSVREGDQLERSTLVLSHPDGRSLVFTIRDGKVSEIDAGPDARSASALPPCD